MIMANLKCNFITLNVRGIRNRVKRRSIFSYLKDQNCHFYLLQETFSEPKDEHVWKNECDKELLFGKFFNTIDQLQRSPLLKKLNYCMLLAKYYLYNQKLNQIEPELNEFKNRLNFQYRVEKLV